MSDESSPNRVNLSAQGGSTASLYGLGFLGAAVYYVQHATGFWDGVLGILKALFWPGVLLHRVYEMLKM